MVHYAFILLLISTLSSHSINAHALQEKDISAQNQDDFIISLQKELKTPEYSKEILPNDFSHLSYLISFGAQNNQDPLYLRSVIKLFSNLLKRSQYVNASAFSELLEGLAQLLSPYFAMPVSRIYISNPALYDASFIDRFNATINNLLFSKFSAEFDSFRKDPNLFLADISAQIVTVAQEELAQEQLRQSIIRFCDIALSKLIWDPTAHEKTWNITKKIGEQLAGLLEYNVLDDSNDLDDLYWTLLNRYCYFVELVATDMPEAFYAHLREDLRSHKNVLFALKEQDFIIESKLACMQRTIIESETAAYRYKVGLPRA